MIYHSFILYAKFIMIYSINSDEININHLLVSCYKAYKMKGEGKMKLLENILKAAAALIAAAMSIVKFVNIIRKMATA